MRQLYAQERERIRRHAPRQRRPQSREKRLVPSPGIDLPHDAPDRRPALRALQPALHRVDREDQQPHGHASRASRYHHSAQTQLVAFAQLPLHDLVRGKIRRAAWAIAGQRGHRAAKDAAEPAFLIELPHDVDTTFVLLLAGGLALDLQEDFDTLEGRSDERHGDSGEEAGSGDLRDGQLVVFHGREAAHEAFSDIVAPEGDGDWELLVSQNDHLRETALTHRRNSNERCRDTRVQTLPPD